MTDICKRNNIYPINHLKYIRSTFDGDFTYYKNEKKSQIDFILTNCVGREFITSFSGTDQYWHISDDRPVYLNIYIDCITSSFTLLVRAEDFNYEFSPDTPNIQRYTKSYNLDIIDTFIEHNSETFLENMTQQH